jgi:3-oxoacyl-ACP reductase-like protein
MASEWTTVDTFVRDLGVLRSAASRVGAPGAPKAAIETAVREAAHAIDATIDAPTSPQGLATAREALVVAAAVIATLDRDIARTYRLRAAPAELGERARQLIAQAGMSSPPR